MNTNETWHTAEAALILRMSDRRHHAVMAHIFVYALQDQK